jgi:hypothetical protein
MNNNENTNYNNNSIIIIIIKYINNIIIIVNISINAIWEILSHNISLYFGPIINLSYELPLMHCVITFCMYLIFLMVKKHMQNRNFQQMIQKIKIKTLL